nr:PREDICTED: nuclear cap-binding protein subunit 1 [Lepisosteus oculatus]
MSRRRHSDENDGGQPHKRRRTSEPIEIEDRLESLICRVGEKSTSSLESNLEGLAGVLEADLPNYKSKILRILCAVARLLPEKLTVYTTLVGLLNARNYNFGGEFVEAMVRQLKETLKSNLFSEAVYLYPMPRVIFRMFDYTDAPEGPVMPGSHSAERFVIEENLHCIIKSHWRERKTCAAQLLSYPGKNKIPLNYHIVEVIFGELFQLPSPPQIDVMYTTLLIELCKLQPGSLPQVLAQATEMMYMRLDTMNTTCIDRLINWFSHHLSNFQFRWSWDDWSDCLTQDLEKPKPKFVKEVLEKCMRLSYHQRIVDIVPPTFSPLIPANPIFIYKYMDESSSSLPGYPMAMIISNAIKNHSTNDEILALLKDVPNPNQEEDDDEGDSFNPLKIDAFLQTLLHLAAKSFSHSFSALAKFHEVLKNLTDSDEGKLHILRVVYDAWKNHPQMIAVLVDKMIRTQIVDCAAVANWIFSPDMAHDFTRFYVWEILHSTIRKMNKHVQKIQKELEEAKEKLEKQHRRKDSGDEDEFEKNSDEEDGQLEEQIERLQEKVESAQSEQKNLFLVIFQRFIMILTEHLVRCETGGVDFNTPWYKNCIERLQQIFLMHHVTIQQYMGTLENLLFTAELDHHILAVYQQFCALQQ